MTQQRPDIGCRVRVTDTYRGCKVIYEGIVTEHHGDNSGFRLGKKSLMTNQPDQNRVIEVLEYAIPLDLPDSMLLQLALEAHERDMKFNDLVVEIVTKAAEEVLEGTPPRKLAVGKGKGIDLQAGPGALMQQSDYDDLAEKYSKLEQENAVLRADLDEAMACCGC